jgi:hypothetical protein
LFTLLVTIAVASATSYYKTGGLAFVGSFAAQTSWVFTSGLLFVPLFMEWSLLWDPGTRDYKPLAIVILYAAVILLSFTYTDYFYA